MMIGIPKEIAVRGGLEEKRVGLSPSAVHYLTQSGIEVVVERGAGEGAHFSNEEYRKAGASIVYSKEEAYRRADIVVKVQAPREEEWGFLKEDHILIGYLHLAVAPKRLVEILIEKNITAIGLEIVQRSDGTLPLLRPMSKIAGRMAPQIAGRLLQTNVKGGRGILLGGLAGIPPAEVVILGSGTLGTCAAKAFTGIGASVYVMDKDIKKLENVTRETHDKSVTIIYNRRNLEKLVKFADVLLCAVLVPGAKAPILVTREMVKTMRKGSVILDFSVDQGGAVETTRITPSEDFVYIEEGVIHFAVPNVPSWVARTASHALANAIVPYLMVLGKKKIREALIELSDFRKGVYTYKGFVINPHLPRIGKGFREIDSILEGEM